MTIHRFRLAAVSWLMALLLTYALPTVAQTADSTNTKQIEEEVFVIGKRRAYQGNFDDLENPSAVQIIDSELLRDVGALNLNDALDLSASVAPSK